MDEAWDHVAVVDVEVVVRAVDIGRDERSELDLQSFSIHRYNNLSPNYVQETELN